MPPQDKPYLVELLLRLVLPMRRCRLSECSLLKGTCIHKPVLGTIADQQLKCLLEEMDSSMVPWACKASVDISKFQKLAICNMPG